MRREGKGKAKGRCYGKQGGRKEAVKALSAGGNVALQGRIAGNRGSKF